MAKQIKDSFENPQSAENKALVSHIKRLGLSSFDEYKKWCSENGLSTGLYKSESIRKKEVTFAKEAYHEYIAERNKQKVVNFQQLYKLYITNGNRDIFKHKLISNYFSGYSLSFNLSKIKEDELEFLELFSFIEKTAPKLLEDSKFNLAIALFFEYRPYWMQSYNTWIPDSKNTNRQFSSLIKHLFCKYKTPNFLESAWLQNVGGIQSINHRLIEIYLWITSGKNIRTFPKLPIILTKKMANYFLEAPNDYSIDQAIQYGRVIGLGGDKRLASVINETRIARSSGHQAFWDSVIQFFINNPMLDRNQVGPIIDYIYSIKFTAGAPQPGWTIKDKNPETLLTNVNEWHQRLRKLKISGVIDWKSSGINEFIKEEKSGNGVNLWCVVELRSSKELQKEGTEMKHCVSSYSKSCLDGRAAIFSIRKNSELMGTIEVIPATKSIVQVRGKCNVLVKGKPWSILEEWASFEGLTISCRSGN